MATLWQWVMVCLLLTAAVPQVEAQELASWFDQLLVLVKPGDTVSVTDGTGRETGGTISALSSSSLELTVDGSRRASWKATRGRYGNAGRILSRTARSGGWALAPPSA